MGRPSSAGQIAKIDNYEDAHERARRVLPRILFGYIDHGAEDELTLHRNTEAFRDLRFRPRMAVSNPEPQLSTTLFGTEISMPILTAPCGGMRLVHPEGDIALVRAAISAGTMHVMSAAAGFTVEEVGAVEGPKWFQLYRYGSTVESLVDRAQNAGFRALAVTIDTAVGGNREKERKNGYSHNAFQVNFKNALRIGPQIASRPSWFYRYWRDGMPSMLVNSTPPSSGKAPLSLTEMNRSSLSRESHSPAWDEIVRIREQWKGPLLLKGVLTADDARHARDIGANGVIVSNHGGRQLDGAPATMDALPEIVAAVGEELEVLLDSGVRRGVDVLKALAVGAKAVLIGRASVFGLAVGGQAGVERMLGILRADLVRTMRLMGLQSVQDLDPSWLFNPKDPRATELSGHS